MKKYINTSWYKVTADELKNKHYIKRDISELIKKEGFKERTKTKLTFLPRISNSANNKDQKNETPPRKYINYLHTNYRKSTKVKKEKSSEKKENKNEKVEKINNKEKILKIYKRNIDKDEMKKQEEICFYCLSYLEEPLLLECSHKICKKCLDEMILFDKFLKANDEPLEKKIKKSPAELFGLNNW